VNFFCHSSMGFDGLPHAERPDLADRRDAGPIRADLSHDHAALSNPIVGACLAGTRKTRKKTRKKLRCFASRPEIADKVGRRL
jgi:hypothetical protein